MHGDNPMYTSILSHSHFPHPLNTLEYIRASVHLSYCKLTSLACSSSNLTSQSKPCQMGGIWCSQFLWVRPPWVTFLLGMVHLWRFCLLVVFHLCYNHCTFVACIFGRRKGRKENSKCFLEYVKCSTKNYSGGKWKYVGVVWFISHVL